MKKKRADADDLREEYDLSSLSGAVRGKYLRRARTGTNLVLLDPDVAKAYPDSESVNRALRMLRDVATAASPRRTTRRRRRKSG
jgi:hypothetical protein